MLCIIPFCARDKALAVRLAGRIAELGGVEKHDCLLAVHKDTDSSGVIEPLQGVFDRVAELPINDDMIVEREQHTYAANLMWRRVANHVADMNESQPWAWVEPDATPLPGWLDALAADYVAGNKPFMHCLVETQRGKSNSGCGVYPAKVRDYTDRLWQLSNVSWDVLLYDDFAPHTHYTPLIQDVGFLDDDKTLPTFPDAASLSLLNPKTVLFHRCKDGTLIDRLRERETGRARHVREGTGPVEAVREGGKIIERRLNAPAEQAEAPAWFHQFAARFDCRIGKLEEAVFQRNGGDAPCAHSTSLLPERDSKSSASNAAPTSHPKARRKQPKKIRSAAEQAAIDARMAHVRAGKKSSK